MEEIFLLFLGSPKNVILAERECKKRGLNVNAVPLPPKHSSSCGIALEVAKNDKVRVLKFLDELRFQYEFQ